ncbi:MAG: PadR family transcriptional regulator [Tissierellia bacterium]|nr:PadR family transcriptional regulator [Tissierellia bacterium]
MKDIENLVQGFVTELRRGTLTFAVLSCLDEPLYGYGLLEVLNEHNIDIEGNTLYPLLRRLEKQGLLESIWDTSESRPRKYYKINEDGLIVRNRLEDEMRRRINVFSIKGNEKR